MPRRLQQVRVQLDPGGTPTLPIADIRAILRAADGLIAVGGRSLLCKILRGSKASDVLKHGLDRNPAYGFYEALSEAEVFSRIDWLILRGYLQIEYNGRLPVLVYTRQAWEIECQTYASEIIAGFDDLLGSTERPYAMEYLKDRNREMIMLVLDMVQASADPKYVPVLEDWERIDCKKVKQKIRAVTDYLRGSADRR